MKKKLYFYRAILLLLPTLLACNVLRPSQPEQAAVKPTNTPRPTFTHTPTAIPTMEQPVVTDTPAPAAVIPPTNTPLPTETPSPIPVPTDTPAPVPTDTPVPTNPPAPAAPAPTNTPVPAPAGPAVGQFGISGKVIARDKTTFAVGEKAFFTYEATNHTDAPVTFTLLGIKASNGQFNTSWINPDVFQPGVPFRHDDGLAFDKPGTYQVFLAVCYTGCGQANAVWEEYQSGAATITVQ